MSSKIEIANMALSLLSARSITSFTQGTNNSNIVASWYPRSLKFCLNKSLWTFATKRVNLVEYSVTIPWSSTNMDYAYSYPADNVRIFGYSVPRANIREEALYIISNSNTLGALYIFLNDNPETYTPEFEEALAVKLASDMAFAITTDESLAKSMLEKFQSVSLPEALAVNSQKSTPTAVLDDDWLCAKNGGTAYGSNELRY